MDIEEIKERLKEVGTQPEPDVKPPGATADWSINSPQVGRASPIIPDALLWIIEKLQEVPTVEVLQIGEDDVLVGTFDRPVPLGEIEHYRNQFESQFPDNRVVLIEGLALSVVRGET